MSNVLQFRQRGKEKPEVWLTEKDFRKEVAKCLGGHTPSDAWLRARRREGLPSGIYCHRLLIPVERGLAWLKEEGRIP